MVDRKEISFPKLGAISGFSTDSFEEAVELLMNGLFSPAIALLDFSGGLF